MIKKFSGTGPWLIYDSKRIGYNQANYWLQAQVAVAENTALHIDIMSNGIKIARSHGDENSSGGDYLVLAFAESPFKYSNARY